MDNEDLQHLENLPEANRQRLRVLEKQAAISGMDSPPRVLLEIEDIRIQIQQLERVQILFFNKTTHT